MKLQDGINKCTNAEYHGDSKYLSSSSLKLLLKDPAKFYKEKILGDIPAQEEKSYFTEGSYLHSLILEPEMIPEEYAFFPGMRKAGEAWERFKSANNKKMILSKAQKIRCEKYFNGFKDLKVAVDLIKGGEAEHTICATYHGVPIKVRCDYINIDKGYIADVKTSAFTVDHESFKMTVDNYSYDLSACLYLEIVEQYYGKPFDFYFVTISKKEMNCEVYKLSEKSREKGKKNILSAIMKYKNCLQSGVWSDKLEVDKPAKKTDYEILEI